MMRPKPASSMQKTYDDCYLMCSTAVYFEGQNNEPEALKSWRSALETIYYHNAYRVPSAYTPKTETERALQESIRQLELQCRERVDLLSALSESRKDSEKDNSSATSKAKSKSKSSPPPAGWLGDGTVPAVGYTDLSKPPSIPGRPGLNYPQPPSSESIAFPSPTAQSSSSRPAAAPRTTSHSSSGMTSPERRKGKGMPSTLRSGDANRKNNKKKLSPRRSARPPTASHQAAGLAWGSLSLAQPPADRTATDAAAIVSSRQAAAAGDDRSRSHSGDERLMKARRQQPASKPASSEERLTRRPRVSETPLLRRSPAKSVPPTSNPSPKPAPQANHVFPPPSPSGTKPSVKPKPVALRSSQPTTPQIGPSSTGQQSQSQSQSPAKNTSRPRRKTPPFAADGAVVPGLDRMSISPGHGHGYAHARARAHGQVHSPARQTTPRLKRTVTPPSSDPDSLGPKSTTDADDIDEEDEHEDDIDEAAHNNEKDPDQSADDFLASIAPRIPRGVDTAAARQILNDIVVRGDEVHWDDIAGLEAAKLSLKEAVVYPFLRPDLFSGLREPARGMLLFGPPGTGKTMLARAVATESKSTFFSVSASTLTSKWHGESEKLVRALFGLAKALAPSIIFVDEIDSLLSARSGGSENEASRRSKTEFLVQWSDLQRAAAGREQKDKDPSGGGGGTNSRGDASRVLVLAATNMPWDIDEAARRRFVRRQYIPLPEHEVRARQLRSLLGHQVHELTDEGIERLVVATEGFSGSDITALAKDAAMGPLRNLGEALLHTPMDQIRAIRLEDFEASLRSIRPSVSQDGLREYEEWARQFGERGG